MNKRIKTRWLKALRSGKYKQGQNKLKTDQGNFCCLGVLTDLYIKSVEGRKNKARWNGSLLAVKGITEFTGLLPSKVKKWAGIDERNPSLCLKGDDAKFGAAYWNDNTRVGFKGVANRIENSL